MIISHVDVVTIYVEDQDCMVAFFVEKLGFDKRTDAEMGPGRRWVEVVPKAARTSIAILKAADFDRAVDSAYPITFRCDDIERAGEMLNEAGVPVTKIVSEFWGRYRAVTDPEGRTFMIAAPAIGR